MTRNDDMLRSLQTIVQGATAPLQQMLSQVSAKVDTLTADHVRRSDLDDMRREMSQGFAAMESKFVPRDLGEQRYKDLVSDLANHQKAIEALGTKMDAMDEKRQERGFTLSSQVVMWILMSLELAASIIAIIIAVHH